MDDLHASGKTRNLSNLVLPSARARVLTTEGCYVRANSKYVERAPSLLGSANRKLVATPLAANNRNDEECDACAQAGRRTSPLHRTQHCESATPHGTCWR